MLRSDPDGRYLIAIPAVPEPRLELWMTERLRFHDSQPAWQKQLVADLVTDLQQLPYGSDEALSAVFTSDTTDRVDAANVLLYNLNPRSFKNAPSRLRFERSYASAPAPPKALAGGPARFHHRYAVITAPAPLYAWIRAPGALVRWSSVPCMKVVGERAGWHVWLAMAVATVTNIDSELTRSTDRFGMSVYVTVPSTAVVRATEAVKPVFDGIIASFQRFDEHDRPRAVELSRTLADFLGLESGAVLDGLTRRSGRLFAEPPFNARGRPALNPCDDRCVAGEIVIERDPHCVVPTLSGSIFPVTAINLAPWHG